MFRRYVCVLLFVVSSIGFLPGLVQADEDGWVTLFDGRTLDGWTQWNGSASFRAQDGRILGTTVVGSPNSFLCTDEEYGDFELTFEVKVDGALNSGVQIRSKTTGAAPKKNGKPPIKERVNGPQVEIEASGKEGAEAGYIYGEAAGGWVTPEEKLIPHTHFQDGKWNKFRVIAKGPKFQVWINEEMVTDIESEAMYASHPKGFIGLQVHGIGKKHGPGPFDVSWKNIKLRELAAE